MKILLLAILSLLAIGCTAPLIPKNEAVLPFEADKLKRDVIGQRLVMSKTTFWEFSEEDKITIKPLRVFPNNDGMYVQCQLETTKDGKRWLIGGLGMEYKRGFGGYWLTGLVPMMNLNIREQL